MVKQASSVLRVSRRVQLVPAVSAKPAALASADQRQDQQRRVEAGMEVGIVRAQPVHQAVARSHQRPGDNTVPAHTSSRAASVQLTSKQVR